VVTNLTVVSVQLDADGNGSVDFAGPSLEAASFTYTQPGAYVPTVRVTDDQGRVFTARAVVQVYDRVALDGFLQARWNALRDALQRSDVNAAVEAFALTSRDAYGSQLTALTSVGALPTIAAALGPITLVEVLEGAVAYDLRAVRHGIEYSFHVLFVIDTDGVWRLSAF
jgi:hypothetical protein